MEDLRRVHHEQKLNVMLRKGTLLSARGEVQKETGEGRMGTLDLSLRNSELLAVSEQGCGD